MTRAKAVKNALDNAALEELTASPAQVADLQQFIEGKITINEGIERVKDRYKIVDKIEEGD